MYDKGGTGLCVCTAMSYVMYNSVRQRWNWIPKQGEGAGPAKGGGAPGAQAISKKTGPTIIIFVVGGMTYSEMRAAYEAANETGHHVIIGKILGCRWGGGGGGLSPPPPLLF